MPNNGDPVWTRGQLIQMAKNWGNRSNINVMLEGYNWNEQAAFAALDRILTKEEWDYIQGEIDIINDLWPQIEEMERSEEHTSELQSLMRNSYAVFCLKKKKQHNTQANA